MNGNDVNEKMSELQIMKSVLPEDAYDSMKKCINNYFSAEKDNKEMNLRCFMRLEYHFSFNDGKPIIADDDREKIRDSVLKGYYEKKREGLNLFGLGDEFVKIVFDSKSNF